VNARRLPLRSRGSSLCVGGAEQIVLPDGNVKEGVKLVTTPLEIALGISKKLAQSAIVAKVDGGVWDMFRPLEADCTLELCSFEDPDGKEVCHWL